MIRLQIKIRNYKADGAALLVVLFIIMTITVLSLGFLSRSDVELACGENMALKCQMDYLSESALEHAKGLILNPQDLTIAFWTGQKGLQLNAGSSDFYNVNVARDDSVPTNKCNFIIDSNSYRLKDGQIIGRSAIKAQLRLDPCIAFWAGASTIISPQTTINGDVFCKGNLTNTGNIYGDVFATGSITGTNIQGRKNPSTAQPPVTWPNLKPTDFSSTYYIASTSYSVELIGSYVHPNGNFIPSSGNPAGIRYRNEIGRAHV